MVIAISSILLVFFSVSIRFLCAASGEIKMFIMLLTIFIFGEFASPNCLHNSRV